jgi:hypothetical protein
MSEFIPGPYRAEGATVKALTHGRWYTLARMERAKLTPEGCAQQARLFAASLDLLAALETLTHRAACLDQSATHIGLMNCDALAKARAAIHKATEG